MTKPTVKPKKVRRKKYICDYCNVTFYALPSSIHEEEIMCDDCETDRDLYYNTEPDELTKMIRQAISTKITHNNINGRDQTRD